MKKHILFLSLICLFVYSGCVSKIKRIPFPIEEYNVLSKTGNASLTGQAFMKTLGGDVKYAAGCDILLSPITSYSQQWYNESYLLNKPIEDPDPQLYEYTYKTLGDAEGRFAFNNIPEGNYYLITTIIWYTATGFNYSLEPQGGTIAEKIYLKENENLNIVFTHKNKNENIGPSPSDKLDW